MKAPKKSHPKMNSEKSDLNHPGPPLLGGISNAVYPNNQPASWDPPMWWVRVNEAVSRDGVFFWFSK